MIMKSKLLLLLFLASTVFAHHSVEKFYDTSKTITLKGTVDEIVWANPHAFLLISVKNANGATENWAVELGPPNALARSGFDRRTLGQGGQITVTAYGPKAGENLESTVISLKEPPELVALLKSVAERAKANRLAHPTEVTLPDGRTLKSGAGEMWK